jgi:hypothetical protein
MVVQSKKATACKAVRVYKPHYRTEKPNLYLFIDTGN